MQGRRRWQPDGLGTRPIQRRRIVARDAISGTAVWFVGGVARGVLGDDAAGNAILCVLPRPSQRCGRRCAGRGVTMFHGILEVTPLGLPVPPVFYVIARAFARTRAVAAKGLDAAAAPRS